MLRVSNGEEEVVVVDLGLATKDGFKEEDDGYVRGSPFYMAPEQLFNERLDGRTDVYAVGVILYKMLCGVLPFDGTSGAVMTQIIMDRPKPPSEQAKYLIIPGEVEAVAMKAIAKNPGDRFQDIGELKEALLQCRDGPRRIGEDQEPAGKTEPC